MSKIATILKEKEDEKSALKDQIAEIKMKLDRLDGVIEGIKLVQSI